MDINEWKKEAIYTQDNYSELFEDRIWDEFKSEEKRYMYEKLAPALFGRPLADDNDLGFSKEQKHLAESIINKIVKYSVFKDRIHIAVIFVCVYHDQHFFTAPVIRVRTTLCPEITEISKNAFIDHLGRFYSNWQHYLTTNMWYKSWLCVPNDGYYSGERDYSFINQEKYGSLVTKLTNITTKTNVISSVTMLSGAAMSAFPPLVVPGVMLIATSTGIGAPGLIFGQYRSIKTLIDRKVHHQSVALQNSEARQSWLLLLGSFLALSTYGCSRFIGDCARAENSISRTTDLLFSGLKLSYLGVSGAGVLNSLYRLQKEKRKPSSLEILHLTTSVLLFTHSFISVKAMNSIINSDENNTVVNVLKDNRLKINASIGNGVNTSFKFRHKFIKCLKKIEHFSSFNLLMPKFSLKSFCDPSESLKTKIISLVDKLRKGQITEKQYINEVPKEISDLVKVNYTNNKEMLENFNLQEALKFGYIMFEKFNSIEMTHIKKIVETFKEELFPVWGILEKLKFDTSYHFYEVVKQMVVYVEHEILQRRSINPSPSREVGVSVPQHYRFEFKKDISEQSSACHIEKKSKELYDSCQKDSFEFAGFIPELNILTFEQCCSIVNEIVGYEVTTKQWYHKDFLLECRFESKSNTTESISFISVDSASVLVIYALKEKYRLYTVSE